MGAPFVDADQALIRASTHTIGGPLGQGVAIGRRPPAVDLEPGNGVADGLLDRGRKMLARRQ
jgi:hypothetical protein